MSALVDAPHSSDASALVYDTFSATASFLFDGPAAAALYEGASIAASSPAPAEQQQQQPAALAARVMRTKRRRRPRSCKSREETETQRMTHIAVERNRRRQMNGYLAALRSIMPEPYVQRGDQASIVGGAIEYVKELEQQLQCLEAQKRTLLLHHQHKPAKPDAIPMHDTGGSAKTTTACLESSAATATTSNCSSSVTEDAADHAPPPPFAHFFTYPQYVWCHSPRGGPAAAAAEEGGARPGVADIEVTLVETHASLRLMARRRHGQLLGLLTGLQALRLAVLHLGVATMDDLALYTISVKVEEGCGLATVDDIAGAVHHVLCIIIDADATTEHRMLAAS
ncbi:unnamed protein product [Urochloa decumbens]|uniref:BHLH domain-containing protein n=1 Tax=Urochloa decumbens TaxID=240449 RepID=A0ABC9EB15_9POAL